MDFNRRMRSSNVQGFASTVLFSLLLRDFILFLLTQLIKHNLDKYFILIVLETILEIIIILTRIFSVAIATDLSGVLLIFESGY